MLPAIFRSTTIPALAETAAFAQHRHEVLAGNIANVNTPGYRVRDLNQETFQQRLGEMMNARFEPPRPQSPGYVSADPGDPLKQVRETMTNILYHDDTNIDLEVQVAEISKNQMLHNVALTIMNNQFALLQTAISERV